MGEDSDAIKTLANLIPRLYYDLIARVSAGVPFLAMLLWDQKASFQALTTSAWLCFVLLVSAGYVAGLLLTPLSGLWSLPMAVAVWITRRGSTPDWWHWSWNDEIAARDKEAGGTLAKMQAEATLCQNLLTGFVVLVLADESGTFRVTMLSDHGAGYRWFLFAALASNVIFRQIVYLRRQANLYEIYVKGKVSKVA